MRFCAKRWSMAAQKNGLRARPRCQGKTGEAGLRSPRRGALEHGGQTGLIGGLARWSHGPPHAGCGVGRRDPGAYWAVAQLRLSASLGAGATKPGAAAGAPVNVKRVYRVMRDHGLLLDHRRRPQMPARRHDGQVAVLRSNQRWCAPTGLSSAATMAALCGWPLPWIAEGFRPVV
jgi:hypothetical protein